MHVDQILVEWMSPLWRQLGMNGITALLVLTVLYFTVKWAVKTGVKEVTYKDWKKAYTMSFYPGMQKVDTFTNKLETDRWMDIVTAHCFVVY